MSRTITALFDTRQDAEDGKARLEAANCDASRVRIHDQNSMDADRSSGSSGMWSSNNAPLPHEDRHTYEEGMRRGGFVLTADVDDDDVDGAVRALENTRGVDLDERASSWRNEGWSGPPAAGSGAGMATGAMSGGNREQDRGSGREIAEEHIPVVEEELVVGKREVERGGARVRSYVKEVPVHEQVTLREEHVEVERRPVDGGRGGIDGDAFRERTIDMNATSEEAVVAKEARVVEEVVVRKTADQHVETVDDTVRHTEVDVDDVSETGRSSDPARRL